MPNYYNDEEIKKNSPQNYDLIKQAKNAYITAQQAGDTAGMQAANNQANAVRSAYGYTSADGINFTPIQSTWGNAYREISGMNKNITDANERRVNAQTQQNVYNLDRSKAYVNQNYNQSVKSLEQSKMQQTKALPEQMAKLGLYGSGTGETAYSNIINAYTQQLANLNAQRNQALYDIDTQINLAKQKGAEQLADFSFQMAMQQPQYYLNMLQAQQEDMRYKDQTAYSRGRDIRSDFVDDRNYQTQMNMYSDEKARNEQITSDNKSDSDWNKKFSIAQYLAQFGDFSGFEELGLTPAQIENMRRAYQANFTKPSVSAKTSTGGKTSGKEIDKKIDDKPTNNLSAVKARIEQILNSSENLGTSQKNVARYVINSNLSLDEKDAILEEYGITEGIIARVIGG